MIDKVDKLVNEINNLSDTERDDLFSLLKDKHKMYKINAESMKVNKEFQDIEDDIKD